MNPKNGNTYQAPALEKGLDILEYLSLESSALSQTEIAEGLNKSTNKIYRMLVCLEKRGYLIRDEISGKYRLSLKLYHLSHSHSPVDDICRVARYPMQKLSNDTKQSCHLGTIYNNQLMVILQSKSPGPISLSIEEGSLFPLILTTSGRLLLAFMPEFEREELLDRIDRYKRYSPKKQREFLHLFDTIHEQGFYSAVSEVTKGVTDIVVPLGIGNSNISISLAISILTNNLGKMITMEKLVDKAKKTADTILAGIN